MSELSSEGKESKTLRSYHDQPPQYDSDQPSQDILICVIENEHTYRTLLQRLDDLEEEWLEFTNYMSKVADCNYLLASEKILELAGVFKEMAQVVTELANICKERTTQITELYIAMSRLTDSEFNRTYDSLKRDPKR